MIEMRISLYINIENYILDVYKNEDVYKIKGENE